MTIPSEFFTIVNYRDFYDVPRLILARDEFQQYWIFDSAFDDDLDEYPNSYNVFFFGNDRGDAEHAMAQKLKKDSDYFHGVMPVTALDFDFSKRHAFTLRL